MKIDEPTMGEKPKDSTDEERLAKQWDSIDWHKVITIVNRLQKRIVKATIAKDWKKVKKLSYLLVHSFSAKLLAVRRVTSNKGKNTPGVDGEIWNTPALKMKGALSLTDKHYRAKPLKRVFIEKKGKKEKRPLGIPTMYDRAMQMLYAFALSPIQETTGDKRSFGFRRGRSAQDAIQYLFTVSSNRYSPEWVLDADIKGCFDNISHEWLLQNIPMDKSILKQFLKAGYIFEEQLFPTEGGTPQGGVVSPILANMTLDGLQKTLKNRITIRKVNIVRYADDMVITAPSKEVAEEIKKIVTEFLNERGLKLSEEKTHIVHINEGYDFLGQNIRKYNGKLIIKPSKKSIESLNEKLHEVILDKGLALTQEELIKRLNPIIRGWSNYHKYICAKEAFRKIAYYLFQKLWCWAKRRHTNKGKIWIADRYWHRKDNRKWVFSCNGNELLNIADVKIERRCQLKTKMNPFLDQEYFYNRKGNIVIH